MAAFFTLFLLSPAGWEFFLSIGNSVRASGALEVQPGRGKILAETLALPRIGEMSEEAAAHFDQLVSDALDELPDDIRELMTNVAVTVEDEPPPGQNLLGLYQGVPWGSRGPYYTGALPDKITIYRLPLERIAGGDPERLRAGVRRVVFHEIAHHFGISDQRLVDIDRY